MFSISFIELCTNRFFVKLFSKRAENFTITLLLLTARGRCVIAYSYFWAIRYLILNICNLFYFKNYNKSNNTVHDTHVKIGNATIGTYIETYLSHTTREQPFRSRVTKFSYILRFDILYTVIIFVCSKSVATFSW